MICSFITTILIFLFVCSCSSSFSVPKVIYEGFTWGENLVFDGLGSLFATDYERGELWRLYACTDEEEGFCSELYLNDDENIKSMAGLAVSSDGSEVFVGCKFVDGSEDEGSKYGIIKMNTSFASSSYELVAYTNSLPNGLAYDSVNKIFYMTDVTKNGSISMLNMLTGELRLEEIVTYSDGAYFDVSTNILIVSELISKSAHVYATNSDGLTRDNDGSVIDNTFAALSNTASSHLFDDFTLDMNTSFDVNSPGSTIIFAADGGGRRIMKFSLDGAKVEAVDIGDFELYEPTSVRWGKGKGFDPGSIYVTEGGAVSERRVHNRRIIEIPIYNVSLLSHNN